MLGKRTGRFVAVVLWGLLAAATMWLLIAWLLPQNLEARNASYLLLAGMAFFFDVFQLHVGVAILLLAGAGVLVKRRRLAIALGGVALLTLAGPIWDMRPRSPVPAQGPTVRVMALNLYFNNVDSAAVIEEIDRWDPDILLLEETSSPVMPPVLRDLSERYPYRTNFGRYALAHAEVFSKLPLVGDHTASANVGVAHGRYAARLKFEGQEIAIFGVHLASPTRRGMILHNRLQAAELADAIEAERAAGRAVVVAGDHNFTTNTANAAALYDAGLRTSFDDAGAGRDGTWPSSLPGILGVRIDHIWLSPELRATAHHIGRSAGSDHRAVIADITLAR